MVYFIPMKSKNYCYLESLNIFIYILESPITMNTRLFNNALKSFSIAFQAFDVFSTSSKLRKLLHKLVLKVHKSHLVHVY